METNKGRITKRKGWKYALSIITIVALLLTGCGSSQGSQTESGTAETADTTSTTDTIDATTTTSYNTASTSEVVVDTEFTASDLDVGYEDITSTHITFDGSNIQVSGDGATSNEDSVLTISDEGTYVIAGNLEDGQIVVDAEDTDKVQIVLNGVSITNADSAPIYIKNADKVFITLEEGTDNTLTDGTEYIQTDDNTVDGVIFSTADLTFNGNGILNITGNYKHGIVSKDDIIFTGGTFNITAVKDAINGKDCVKINDGTFNLSAETGNGIQSKNDEDSTKGYVYINGGTITILKCQEGIEGTVILIEDGTINITSEDDGLNASSGSSETTADTTDTTVDTTADTTTTNETSKATPNTTADAATDATTDATTNATTDAIPFATDDNANAAKTPGRQGGMGAGDFGGAGGGAFEVDANCYISITGGTINIDVSGDGIDSNGNLYISGGNIFVSGPTNSGNGGLDYNGIAEIMGGTIVVAGATGMAQGFSDTSSQYSLLYNMVTESAAGTEIKLTDKNGNVVISYTPNKQYQSVVISTPELTKDETYTLTSGEQTAEITLASVVTSNGEEGMFGQGGKGGQNGMERPSGQDGMERPEGQEGFIRPEDANTIDSEETTDSN